jgi:hypothetical protein
MVRKSKQHVFSGADELMPSVLAISPTSANNEPKSDLSYILATPFASACKSLEPVKESNPRLLRHVWRLFKSILDNFLPEH